MRRKLPRCPYCGERMFPQATQDSWISYVCNNAECKAVSPRDRTFGRALNKADTRAKPVLEWFNRDEYQPARDDDFLCEYAFVDPIKPDEKPSMLFYGVRRWYVAQEKFAYEKEGPDRFNQVIRVLRWMDFKGTTATQGAERRMEVRG